MSDMMQRLWDVVVGAGSHFFGYAAMAVIVAIYLFPFFAMIGLGYLWWERRKERFGQGEVDGVMLADAYHYAQNHLWVGGRASGGRKVGVDDLGRRILGRVTSIALPAPGTVVRAGAPLAKVACGKDRELTLKAPCAGTVVAVNENVARNPELVQDANYTRGWLFAIRPENDALRALPTGTTAREWAKTEEHRFAHFLEQQFGLAAADGGRFMVPPPELLPEEKWRELADGFLG